MMRAAEAHMRRGGPRHSTLHEAAAAAVSSSSALVVVLLAVGDRLPARRGRLSTLDVETLLLLRGLLVVTLRLLQVLLYAVEAGQGGAVHVHIVELRAHVHILRHGHVVPRLPLEMRVVRKGLLEDHVGTLRVIEAGSHAAHAAAHEGVELGAHVAVVLELPRARAVLVERLVPKAGLGELQCVPLGAGDGEGPWVLHGDGVNTFPKQCGAAHRLICL